MGHGEEEHFARVFVTHKPSFTLCLDEGTENERCIPSDTVWTIVFGLACILSGLVVSGILQLLDKQLNGKKDKANAEEGAKITVLPDDIKKAGDNFERESYARSSVNSVSSARKRAIGGLVNGNKSVPEGYIERLVSVETDRISSLHQPIQGGGRENEGFVI